MNKKRSLENSVRKLSSFAKNHSKKLSPNARKFMDKYINRDLIILFLYIIFFLIFFNGLLSGRLPGPIEYLNIWRPWHSNEIHGSGNFILSDQMDTKIPTMAYVRDYFLKNKSFPLWNDKIGFGVPEFPLAISYSTFPISLFAMLFPMEFYWPIASLLKILLVSFFTYKLLNLYKIRPVLSFLGGLALGFSFYNIVWIGTAMSDSFSTIPFLLFSITYFFKSHSVQWKKDLLIIISFIFIWLSSFPSMILYGLSVSIIYTLWINHKNLFSKNLLRLGILSLLSLGISFIPLLLSYNFLNQIDLSYRLESSTRQLPLDSLYLLFSPNFWGNYESSIRGYNENVQYFGIFFLFLCIVNLPFLLWKEYRRQNRHVVFWTGVQLVTLSIVYNIGGILRIISMVPLFNLNPNTRMLGIFVISSIIVSISLLNFLISHRRKIKKAFLFGAISILLTIISILLITKRDTLLSLEETGYEILERIIFLLMSLFLLSGLLLVRKKLYKTFYFLLLILISFLDSYLLGGHYNSYYTRKSFYPKTEIIYFLEENLDGNEKILSIGRNLIPHTQLIYGISSIESHWYLTEKQIKLLQNFDSSYRDKRQTQDFFEPFNLIEKNSLLDFLNIKYLIVNEEEVSFLNIDGEEFSIAGIFPNNLVVIENINRNSYIESEVPKECNQNSIYSFRPELNGHSFYTNFCEDKTLLLPIASFNGWSGEIDNKTIKINSKDDLISLNIPSGIHHIKLSYSHRNINLYLFISATFTVITAFFIFGTYSKRKIKKSNE